MRKLLAVLIMVSGIVIFGSIVSAEFVKAGEVAIITKDNDSAVDDEKCKICGKEKCECKKEKTKRTPCHKKVKRSCCHKEAKTSYCHKSRTYCHKRR